MTFPVLLALLLAGVRAAAPGEAEGRAAPGDGARSYELVERISLDAGGRPLRLWLPVPTRGPEQSVEILDVRAPFPHRRTVEREFGNETLYFEASSAGRSEVVVRYRVLRRQVLGPAGGGSLPAAEARLHTRPRGLVIVDPEVRALAARAAGGVRDPLEAGRRLYAEVLRRMAYDKTAPGWGRGDTRRACRVGKGNCTDFHSLFQSLAIARGLPARFTMGLPVSGADGEELGRKYHCWAEFHAAGRGWVPVDISEAWKAPEKRAFFFGALDAGRIALSRGRELRLEPPQAGPPLNFLAYPYAEVGGEPFEDYTLERKVAAARWI